MELPIIEPASPTRNASTAPDDDSENASRGRYAFVTLGCPKNLVDSEKMLGTLALDGYTLVNEADGADFVIVNTCGFIDSARQESKAVIEEMLELKRAGRTGGVIVAGCLPERVGGGLLKEMPEIDHVVGVFGRDEINRVADRMVGGASEQRELFRPAPITAMDDRSRLRITPAHFAYLKISEGCDRTCTFCAIPRMRGKHVTKPIEMVLEEARELADDGVRELNIVAQDTTYYGIDLYGEPRLTELLRELEHVDGVDWIRLMYLYPVHFSDELIDVIAGSSKIIPYLDMPLQHINDRMLKRMQRRVNREKTVELVEKLRSRIPNLVLRTTFITGFPGETDEQFEELREFVIDSRFERMGVFTYSIEPDTPAVKLDDHLPEDVKHARRDELMQVQQQNAFDFGDSLVGYELDALIDAPVETEVFDASSGEDDEFIGQPNGARFWQARIYADAPEIDGVVYVSGENLSVGHMVPVEIIDRRDYDLVAIYEPDA